MPLVRAADELSRRSHRASALPHLLLFTDPVRTPEPVESASRLPRGTGVVFRAFGAADAVEQGLALRRVCDRVGLTLLVGADPRLAVAVGADGLHLPERMISALPSLRARWPRWWLTAAAHSLGAARRAAVVGADCVIVSPIFPSRSPSAVSALGVLRLAGVVRSTPAPVLALGGVDALTARRLRMSGVAGIAAIEALT